jgi:hypothetical protein
VSGQFDVRKYPFIRQPLLSLDDISVRDTVVYGPAQSFKSVFLQIATAYRLGIAQNTVLAVAQSDDDADEFAKVKLNPFLERISHLYDMQVTKHTINLWRWANHELIISGPGTNAQNSKSARFIHTDESHLYKLGTLAALTDRSGQRWNRHGLHVTTAADEGTEVDVKYHQGNQQEWHVRCLHCNALFMPLWEEESRRVYNGHRVFQWLDNGSETATLDSIEMVCPNCDKAIENTPRNRVMMDDGADYIAMNPAADKSTLSFRWNAFASRYKPLRDLLSIYLKAIESAKLGDFKPYENWVKKQEVRTWTGEIPQVGNATIGRDHSIAQIEVVESDLVIGSCDVQSAGGFHIWALCDVWHPNGDSKRLAYDKLASFDDLRAWQLRHCVKDFDSKKDRHPFLCADHGHLQSDTFAACARHGWLALKSTDDEGFSHVIKRRNIPDLIIEKPWSTVRAGNPLIGKSGSQNAKLCATRLWSKPRLYSMLFKLKNGDTSRKYGIADDINPLFVDQLHSYSKALTIDKKTGSTAKEYWRQIRKQDHSFICAAQSLMMAIMHGQYSAPDLT